MKITMNNQEKKDRIELLEVQMNIKKQQIEKLLQELKTICVEIIELKEN